MPVYTQMAEKKLKIAAGSRAGAAHGRRRRRRGGKAIRFVAAADLSMLQCIPSQGVPLGTSFNARCPNLLGGWQAAKKGHGAEETGGRRSTVSPKEGRHSFRECAGIFRALPLVRARVGFEWGRNAEPVSQLQHSRVGSCRRRSLRRERAGARRRPGGRLVLARAPGMSLVSGRAICMYIPPSDASISIWKSDEKGQPTRATARTTAFRAPAPVER